MKLSGAGFTLERDDFESWCAAATELTFSEWLLEREEKANTIEPGQITYIDPPRPKAVALLHDALVAHMETKGVAPTELRVSTAVWLELRAHAISIGISDHFGGSSSVMYFCGVLVVCHPEYPLSMVTAQ